MVRVNLALRQRAIEIMGDVRGKIGAQMSRLTHWNTPINAVSPAIQLFAHLSFEGVTLVKVMGLKLQYSITPSPKIHQLVIHLCDTPHLIMGGGAAAHTPAAFAIAVQKRNHFHVALVGLSSVARHVGLQCVCSVHAINLTH